MQRFEFIARQGCIGCNACQVACKDEHNTEPGLFFRKAETVWQEEKGTFKFTHRSVSCRHCQDAPCVRACPVGAMHYTEDWAVVNDQGRCTGCGACVSACPYGAVMLSPRLKTAVKCDSCIGRRRVGKAPACVDACPVYCLGYKGWAKEEEKGSPEFSENRETGLPSSGEQEESFLFSGEKQENVLISEGNQEERHLFRFFQAAARFFAGWEQALPLCRAFPDWEAHTRREWKLEYDALFSGADAACQIPLWASACRDGVLLNQVTLEVIRFYHRWGYEPLWIDGNPPDYIGEQLRFLAYLTAGLCHGHGNGSGADELCRARESFIREYVLETAETIREGAKKRNTFEGFLALLSLLCVRLKGEEPDGNPDGTAWYRFLENADVFAENTAMPAGEGTEKANAGGGRKDLANVLRHGLYPPIPDKGPEIIPTAGLNNCGGICVIRPTVQEGCVLKIESDTENVMPQIRACVRGRGYRKTFLNPGRLRYPMKRAGKRGEGKFERISWEEAVSIIAGQWKRIRDRYGPGSRYVNYGWGVGGIMRPGALAGRLLALDGGYLDYYNSYSSACVNYVSPYIFGTLDCENSASDLLNTRLLILWGDNPAETVFGPEKNYYLSKLKENGIRIVAIDPRLSQTAVALADEWIPIRPSTDGALADAMAYVIWTEGLKDQAFMDRYCLGFDEEHMPEGVKKDECYRAYLFGEKDNLPKTPEWASAITGISPDKIRGLAREYAGAKPACILPGLGPQRHGNGEQTARGICMLACLTGNIGIPGGGSGGAGWKREHQGIKLFPNQVKNPYPGKIPVFLWTKAVERGEEMTPEEDGLTGVKKLDTGIKMILNLAGNALLNQHSDINRTAGILSDEAKCEFILCSDIFMTPSARFADILLPATSVLEGNNLIGPWRGNNYLLRNNQVASPLFACRFEWEWLKETAACLGLYEAFVDGKPDSEQWLKESYQVLREKEPGLPEYGEFCRKGGWQYRDPVCFVAFEQEVKDPENHPFGTPSGKIEIFSRALYDLGHDLGKPEEIPGIPRYVPCPEGPEDKLKEKYPLQLIGWHTRRRCHSIHDNNEWMEEVEKPGVWLHPEDAKARGIEDGDLVEVKNGRGVIRIPAIVTRRIMQGVAAISQGGWYTPDEKGRDVRGSINVLTSLTPTPLAKGNPQHTNLVEVCRVAEDG